MFQFKQFSILQDKSAMKVGTDGVLLGAWIPVKNATHILDIGAGTGLIALMLAQRNSKAKVDAIEIEENAFLEAQYNFKNADWKDRLKVFHSSLQDFKTSVKYDLIVSNPPYFTDTFKNNNTEKALARHVDNLSFQELLSSTVSLLTKNGTCAFIVPFTEEENFISLAKENHLFIQQITRVKGRVDLPFKRSLLCFMKVACQCLENELVVEIDRHLYTEDYIKLTKPFYLKM